MQCQCLTIHQKIDFTSDEKFLLFFFTKLQTDKEVRESMEGESVSVPPYMQP